MSGRPSVTFRAAEPGDSEFLLRLYASTRAEELAVTGWSDEQKSFFVNQQFTAQTQHYALHYSAADCRIILVDGQPAGRLIILRTEKELRLVDIALLPPYRGKGIGSALVQDVMRDAAAEGRSVTIHVEKFNPALRLYHRLGFKPVEDKGVHWLMEWKAS